MEAHGNSVLAKLLANENITVVEGNVRTAAFDVKQRILYLPIWSVDDVFVKEHMTGHEVGHALFTPEEGWHEAVCDKGAGYKSFLNVVEDARIEKLVQRRYPGLRSSFIKSYRKLLKDGFFGADINAINKMQLIDRINVYFKCGVSAGVKFAVEERVWLKEIDNLETWEQVVELTDRLFAFAKQQIEEQKEEQQAIADDFDDEDGIGDSMESSFDDDAEASDEEEDGEPEEDTDEEGKDEFDQLFDDAGESEPKSETDEELRNSIDSNFNSNFEGDIYNLKMPKFNANDYVVSYKEMLGHVKSDPDREEQWDRYKYSSMIEIGTILYNKWREQHKKSVNHMVKEFEMRKSASDYQRASISKTGVIDTVKMNNYKLTDDIFKKITVVPEGKNHGFVMFLDMSGSMNQYMYETIEQLLLLVHFTRSIGVPFRVYGFSDSTHLRQEVAIHEEIHTISPSRNFALLELFNEKMSQSETMVMCKALLANFCTRKMYYSGVFDKLPSDVYWYEGKNRIFELGGTPLDSAIMFSIPLVQEFRKSNRIDILNSIFLTDGHSHPMRYYRADGRWDYIDDLTMHKNNFVTISYGNTTRRLPSIGRRSGDSSAYLSIYRELTGSVNVGYRIVPNGKWDLLGQLRTANHGLYVEGFEDILKEYRKEGYHKCEFPGYDEMFIIPIKSLTILDSKMDSIEAGAGKGKIRTAFKRGLQDSKKTKKMLVDLMKRVA